MKIRIRFFIPLLLVGLAVSSCNKNINDSLSSTATTPLTATASIAKKGQPVTFTVPSSLSSAAIKWTATPPANVNIVSNKTSATATFSASGTYTISAFDSTGQHHDSACTTIIINDSTYIPHDSTGHDTIPAPPPVYDTLSISGDTTIVLSPLIDTFGVVTMRATTDKNYGCSASFIYGLNIGSAQVTLNFVAVVKPHGNNCGGASSPADVAFIIDTHQLGNGTFPLTVIVSGTTYTGQITVSNTGVDFTWNHTTGVVITPLHIDRTR